MGRIPPEYLPSPEAWRERVYTLPEVRAYPQRLNSTEELLDRHVAERRGDRAAILFEGQRITYATLAAQVNSLAGALRGLGIGEEDRVLLRAPSIPPALVANFAVIKLGAVIVPISPLFSHAEIAHVATNTEAVALIVAAPAWKRWSGRGPSWRRSATSSSSAEMPPSSAPRASSRTLS